MQFLISSEWVLGEAADLKIHISRAKVRSSFERIRANEFPKHGEFGKFLEQSGQSAADLLCACA